MTRARAFEILELSENATRDQVVDAYTRLMKQVHPDKGGSTYFAKQFNEAREVLLG
jgi:curved DNA-binding protein CbpA